MISISLLLLTPSWGHAELPAAEQYLSQGNDFLDNHQFDQAIYDYTQALDLDPNFAKAYDNRGVAYAQEGSYDRAIADFTMAIASDPNDLDAYNNRGRAYADKGNPLEAIADYTAAIRINAFYFKAYTNREYAYYQLKEYDKAWSDVFTLESMGGHVDPDFYKALKKASGKSQ